MTLAEAFDIMRFEASHDVSVAIRVGALSALRTSVISCFGWVQFNRTIAVRVVKAGKGGYVS